MKKRIQRNMNIEETEMLYTRNLDIKNRILYFCPWQPNEEMIDEEKSWEVNDWSVQNALKGLYILEQSKIAPITIVWMSYGGDWNAGMALFDYMKQIKSPITLKAYGRIRSMGTIILQAANKRILSAHCEFLIHYGSGIGDTSPQTKDILASADEAKKVNKVMEDIYLNRIREKHPRYTREQLQETMMYDTYLSPKEAVRLGLADSVMGG